MGHTKPSDLVDIQDVIENIRMLEGLNEKSPNVFYFKSKPFMHFHDKDGRRWADVKDGDSWGNPLDIPFESNLKRRKLFFKEVEKRYRKILKSKPDKKVK